MTVPLSVVIAQWILLASLGILVVVFYRQLALLIDIGGTRSTRAGLNVGSRAPEFEYVVANDHGHRGSRREFSPREGWSVLMFADPLCLTCEQALQALERAIQGQGATRALVLTTAPLSIVVATPTFGESAIEVGQIDRMVATDLYRTQTAPYFYVIGPDGLIRERGLANDEPGITRLLSSRDRHALTSGNVQAVELVQHGGGNNHA